MIVDLSAGGPVARRAITVGAVLLVHGLLIAMLTISGTLPPVLPAIFLARLIVQPRRIMPPPPRIPIPDLAAAPLLAVPLPDIRIASPAPPAPTTPRAISRAGPPDAHFGVATEAGLAIDVATTQGGGAGSRGTLAAFEAAVRRQVLAGKRQPMLAWDRRNTCVVNYRVTVTRAGGIAGFSIDPCAVPEINAAARMAISRAAPLPPPPDLGAASYDVHGSLIFHP